MAAQNRSLLSVVPSLFSTHRIAPASSETAMAAAISTRPKVGDVLVVIHDFAARSSDELALAKGDRVELIERDDEFGDGWFLGKHTLNGNSGLFPEVYTRPAPKKPPSADAPPSIPPSKPLKPLTEIVNERYPSPVPTEEHKPAQTHGQSASQRDAKPVTLPLDASKSNSATRAPAASKSNYPIYGNISRGKPAQDNYMLHETLNVINEHITDLNSSQGHGSRRNNNADSSSEYSAQMNHRMSYIQGEETDEEEEGATHSRVEVEAWSADAVAEYLFTSGVEKHHCEVFRDQEITGEVLLGMDQASLFIKALDLGSVGRRLKTWQKIKALQDEVKGQASARRTTSSRGSEVGTDMIGRMRSGMSSIISVGQKPSTSESRSHSVRTTRSSLTQTLTMDAAQPKVPVSPSADILDSPTHPIHEKRPSAASIRDLHHSRRHSSTDRRLTGTTLNPTVTPKLMTSGTFPFTQPPHRKQPSFDRNWTMGAAAAYSPRSQSSAGYQDGLEPELHNSAVDLDRGYFSGTEADPSRRNVFKKCNVALAGTKASYADEQRARSGTALSKYSHFGSTESVRDRAIGASLAAQRYYGVAASPLKRTASTTTGESARPGTAFDSCSPTVTRLDASPNTSGNHIKRLSQVTHADFNINIPKAAVGTRAASDAVTGNERSKVASLVDSPFKDSLLYSPSRTGSSTPSAGPSFDLDSPDATKSPSTTTTLASRASGKKSKTKKETSAYTRGLQKISPREAMLDADYSGWMKKRSSNLMTTWKPRLFVLKGRRLAYYYSEDDEMEKGLIDISFHRVLPADNEKLTGLHATLTGALVTPTTPAGSLVQTLAETDAEKDPTKESDAVFIFKLVPPRAGLSRAVNFTRPTLHYFAVPNIKQGRLWMAALMKATIDRDDTKPITSTYQQKTISLSKARQMRHRPPALMNLEEKGEDIASDGHEGNAVASKNTTGLGIHYDKMDSVISGEDKLALGLSSLLDSSTETGLSHFTVENKESLTRIA